MIYLVRITPEHRVFAAIQNTEECTQRKIFNMEQRIKTKGEQQGLGDKKVRN